MTADRPLGTPRGPIQVTHTGAGLRIDIPVRRSRLTWAVGVPSLAIGSLMTILYGAGLVWSLTILSESGLGLALPAIAIASIFGSLAIYGVFPLMAVNAAFMLFGTQVVTLEGRTLRVKRCVGRFTTFVRTTSLDGAEPVVVSVCQNQYDRRRSSYVRVVQDTAGHRRTTALGDTRLSPTQAEQIAMILREALGGAVEPALQPDTGSLA